MELHDFLESMTKTPQSCTAHPIGRQALVEKKALNGWFEYVPVVCFKMFPKGPKFEELNVQSIDLTFKDSFQCILW